MSLEQEKGLSRRSLEMWGSDNSDKPEDVFAQNYVNHLEPDAKGGKAMNIEERDGFFAALVAGPDTMMPGGTTRISSVTRWRRPASSSRSKTPTPSSVR